jgi:hypothetical protein
MTGAFRKYLKVTIVNSGRAKAENCYAILTLIQHNSTSQLQPSSLGKNLVWDNGEYYRTLSAKNGDARLNVAFSQDTFANLQIDSVQGKLEENKKIHAKVSTIYSLNSFDINKNQFAEDGIGIGDTYFKLFVKAITGACKY